MSNRYKGGIISATPPTTTGGEDGVASGAWTLEQQMQAQAAGLWPLQPTGPWIEDCFSTWLYTGNGATQTIANGINLSGKGGLVWIKRRNGVTGHSLIDTARGTSKTLLSNATLAEVTYTDSITSFNSNGFSLGADTQGNLTNLDTSTYVSWTFREQPKFFDVVTYTGTGTTMTVPHNLGAVPGCMIVKGLNAASAWDVYHQSLGPTQVMRLSTTDAASGQPQWDNTAPTSTVFTVKGGETTNVSGRTYVAYLFAHNAGGFGASGTDNVISCGSYTGNGSSTGPTVTLGYEPQWVMIKRTDAVNAWFMLDSMRGMSVGGGEEPTLVANGAFDESTYSADYLSPSATGFQIVNAGGNTNANGGTYIYIAIRRGPMRTPTTGTSVFAPATYTGNGANQTFTNTVNNGGSLVVIKGRNSTFPNVWYDQLRGAGNALVSNSTSAALQADPTYEVSAFTNKGFSLGANFNYDVNNTSAPFVYWQFVRAPGFFDEVCYTGTGSNDSKNHNLGVVPELVILKARNSAIAWYVMGDDVLGGAGRYLSLNTTAAYGTGATHQTWTSTTFSTGSLSDFNGSGTTYVAYLFATCAGVSKVGSYTGTGTTQVINCGFTGGARFVLIKRTDSTGDWYVWDTARGMIPANDPYLLLNSTAAEVTGTDFVDTAATGFEITSTAPAAINANGGTFIFLAVA